MKIRIVLEVDSEEFGKFFISRARTSTLDKVSMGTLADMAQNAMSGHNDLIKESKLIKIERGEMVNGNFHVTHSRILGG